MKGPFQHGHESPIQPGTRTFLHTLRVLSPTPTGWVPVSSHPSGAQSHPCGVGPYSYNIKEINRFRRGDLHVAGKATVRINPEIDQ